MADVARTWSTTLADGRRATVRSTDRSDGDLAIDQDLDELDARRRSIVDLPWTWLRQVHGNDVVTVTVPGGGAGTEADASVTGVSGAALAVQTADCAPVAFVDRNGVIGVAHAGWRGLAAGVLERTVEAMMELGAGEPVAVLGPCIRPDRYEFSPDDLDTVAGLVGDAVRATTADDAPALNLPGGVGAVLERMGVPLVADIGGCTAAEADSRWSHRARRDRARQCVVVWIDPA